MPRRAENSKKVFYFFERPAATGLESDDENTPATTPSAVPTALATGPPTRSITFAATRPAAGAPLGEAFWFVGLRTGADFLPERRGLGFATDRPFADLVFVLDLDEPGER